MDVPRNVDQTTTSQGNKQKNPKSILEITSERIILPETGAAGNMIKSLGKNFWSCRVCSQRLAEDKIIPHVSSNKHITFLQRHKEIYTDGYKPPAANPKHPAVNLKPPADPSNRLRVALERVSMKPMIGIEYILEIVGPKKPRYLCTLCDNTKCGLPVSHLQTFPHKMRYVMEHFKTAHRHFNTMKVKKVQEEFKPILNKLAWEIHKTYGRLKPTQISSRDFAANKEEALQIPHKREHICESYGNTFEDLVIEELIKRNLATIGPSKMEASSKKEESTVKNKTREKDFGGPKNLDETQKCKEKSISNNDLNSQQNLIKCTQPRADTNKDDNANKMELFNKLAKDIDDEMEKVLLKYRENPDDHPQYNDEWKKFWKRRYMDLQTEGKDISTYDFIPEWKEFWNERILELNNEETKTKKIALGEMLGLLDEPIPVPTLGVVNKDREVVLIDDDINCETPPKKRKRSVSPMIKDSSPESRRRRVSPSFSRNSPRRRESPSHNKYSLGGEESSHRRTSPLQFNDSPSHRRHSPSRRKDSSSHRRDSPSRRGDSPSYRRDSPSRRSDSPSRRRDSSSHRRDSPSRRGDSRSRHKNSPSRRRDSPSCRRDSSSYRRDSPSRCGDSPSRHKNSPSRRRDSPSRRRDSSSHRRDSPSRRGDSPSRHKNSPSRRRDSPSRRRDSPSYRRDSPSHRRNSPSYRRDREYPERTRKKSGDRSRSRGESREITQKRDREVYKDSYNKESSTIGHAEINVIGVLRLLTALEDRLGSLGPKVIEMLSNALVMENKKSKSSEELLDNETNCILLETVGEKLKGQLQSGLVDRAQEKVFRTVIKDVESVVHIAKQRNRRKRLESTENLMVVPGVGIIDKEKMSKQIVDTLIGQGKNDISQEELIEMIKVLAEKDSSQPTKMTDNYKNIASSEWSSSLVQGKRDDKPFQHKPTSGRMNENDRYTSFSVFNTTARIDEKEKKSFRSEYKSFEDIMKSASQKLKENQRIYEEEKRKIEHKNLNDTKSLVGPLMNNPIKGGATSLMVATNTDWNSNAKISNISGMPANSIATNTLSAGFSNMNKFSSVRQRGFSTPDGNKSLSNLGTASLQRNTNQSLLFSNGPLPFSNETLSSGSNIQQRGGRSAFRPESGGDFRAEMSEPKSGIADFRDGLLNGRAGQNVNREGLIDSNDERMPPSFRGNSKSSHVALKNDFRSISNFTKPQANQRK